MALTQQERWSDFVARMAIVALFVPLSVNLWADFVRTRHVTGLFLLFSEALVVILTIFRRRAISVDRTALAAVVTVLSMAGPPLFRAGGQPLVPDYLTAVLSVFGLAVVIAGKIVLGRSFGLVPANRGVVARGPYGLMRHPIYLGYLITHVGFLAANPTPMNLAIVLIGDTALIVRALLEERVLNQDEQYREYRSRVGWHLVPGVF